MEQEVDRHRVDVLGVLVDAVDMQRAVARILTAVRLGAGGYVCVTGVHGVMESQRDPSLKCIHNASLMTTPDGMPMVWMGWLQGARQIRRVYGPSLMLEVCRTSLENGFSHFLLGGVPGRVDELRDALERRFPGISIVGGESPPFRPYTSVEEDELVSRIEKSGASIVWVGLSTPKQERLASRLSTRLPGCVFVAVGAAFDMHSGRLRQAPAWMQSTGLEWLFRLAVEPRRLWRRYLFNNPRFVYLAARQLLRLAR